MTCGETPEKVITNLREAFESYIKTSIANNLDIPEPLKIYKIS